MSFCGKCGNELQEDAAFCPKCGNQVSVGSTQASSSYPSFSSSSNPNDSSSAFNPFSSLSTYYQEEFKKIQESNEAYKGKWNWAAFLFGGFWALFKGLWLSAIITFILAFISYGIFAILYWFVLGFRGNFMYYKKVTENKQMLL